MCFLFTDPNLIIDEPELQSANLNTGKRGGTLSENEASPTRQRYEPRDFKDLTGHAFGTIPPYFKPVLTIPWTERPDQGISELPADLTIIERFTTVTQSEQPRTTSIPPKLTPGTEIEIMTIIDGTKFIPPSSTSDTIPSQESENSSLKDTTTKTTLLTSPSDRSSEASSWTTSYTTDSNTELPPPSSSPAASETSALSDTTRIIVGVFAGAFALSVAIIVFRLARGCVKGPKSRHREQHELQPEPRHELQNGPQYGQSTNVSVTVCPNHAEIQPQKAVPENGWKA